MKTNLLIIGAGPYGLALAMHAQTKGIDYLVVGEPMSFWKNHMPKGMRLRTHYDWGNEQMLNTFFGYKKIQHDDSQPVVIESFIDYLDYTLQANRLSIISDCVQRLDYKQDLFIARLSNGDTIHAQNVVVATGYYDYKRIPPEIQTLLPGGYYVHSADCSDPGRFKDKNCLIIGGRQAAFEYAGLLANIASQVNLVYRHDTPEFIRSDWSWVYPYIEKTRQQPDWFRNASDVEKKQINQRFWFAGRGQLEDWLLPMIESSKVNLWPNTTMTGCEVTDQLSLLIDLNNSQQLNIDQVILATGYEPNIEKLAWLAKGNILSQLVCDQGFACLDNTLQCNIPGLYFTGIHAVKDFGPFFFFVACAETAAEIVGKNL